MGKKNWTALQWGKYDEKTIQLFFGEPTINIGKSNKRGTKKWAYKQWQHKINTSVCKLILTVTENHKDSKNTAHHKLEEYTMQDNSIKKISKIFLMFSLNKSLIQSLLIQINRHVNTQGTR